MSQDKPLINRVANSGLITLNLEDFFPKEKVVVFDLKNYLFKELILKEKDFRAALKGHDWSQYQGVNLLIDCSNDAIIPVWAYMLVAAYAEPFAHEVFQGNEDTFYKIAFDKTLSKLDGKEYDGKRVIIKGCSKKPVPVAAYVMITKKLRPFAQSIMFGEACSTVPIFKRPRVKK
ncbi:MAG TPA: DUF2480 family protein [Phaeodactylibacter sp.]|nr:DUF2480 family protein [Phaeodactylibacter sp.]